MSKVMCKVDEGEKIEIIFVHIAICIYEKSHQQCPNAEINFNPPKFFSLLRC